MGALSNSGICPYPMEKKVPIVPAQLSNEKHVSI
jgi:hypothetical protein